jgi:hypothetical protein
MLAYSSAILLPEPSGPRLNPVSTVLY